MARKVRAAGLWEVKKEPEAEPAPDAEVYELHEPQEAASTRNETLYSFTFRMSLAQRQEYEKIARKRVRPTAPGKVDASAVLREFHAACFKAWAAKLR